MEKKVSDIGCTAGRKGSRKGITCRIISRYRHPLVTCRGHRERTKEVQASTKEGFAGERYGLKVPRRIERRLFVALQSSLEAPQR